MQQVLAAQRSPYHAIEHFFPWLFGKKKSAGKEQGKYPASPECPRHPEAGNTNEQELSRTHENCPGNCDPPPPAFAKVTGEQENHCPRICSQEYYEAFYDFWQHLTHLAPPIKSVSAFRKEVRDRLLISSSVPATVTVSLLIRSTWLRLTMYQWLHLTK